MVYHTRAPNHVLADVPWCVLLLLLLTSGVRRSPTLLAAGGKANFAPSASVGILCVGVPRVVETVLFRFMCT